MLCCVGYAYPIFYDICMIVESIVWDLDVSSDLDMRTPAYICHRWNLGLGQTRIGTKMMGRLAQYI